MFEQEPLKISPDLEIMFLGDACTGKTSIINRIINTPFNEIYEKTPIICFQYKNIKIKNENFKIIIYDTIGQEKFKSFFSSYLKNISLIFLVYDVSNKDSFNKITNWINLICSEKYSKKPFIVLCGNKIDLIREVQKRDGEELAKKYRYLFFECSAKTNENIKYMFYSSIMNLPIFNINNENESEKEILIKKLIEEDKNENKNDSSNIINSIINKINKYKKTINILEEEKKQLQKKYNDKIELLNNQEKILKENKSLKSQIDNLKKEQNKKIGKKDELNIVYANQLQISSIKNQNLITDKVKKALEENQKKLYKKYEKLNDELKFIKKELKEEKKKFEEIDSIISAYNENILNNYNPNNIDNNNNNIDNNDNNIDNNNIKDNNENNHNKKDENKDKKYKNTPYILGNDDDLQSNQNNNINNINNLEYSYECLNKKNLVLDIYKVLDSVDFEIELENNGKNKWPKDSKLSTGEGSEIPVNDIILEQQNSGEITKYKLNVYGLRSYEAKEYKIFLVFYCDGKNYGEHLELKININELN